MHVRNFSFTNWSWSAAFAGAIAAVMFQVLLAMIGYGLGLLTIDIPTAGAAPKAVSWAVFTWWAVSGVISAFVGGWVAANFSDSFTAEGRATHGLMAWALSALIIIGAGGLAAQSTLANSLLGPTGMAMAQYTRMADTGFQTTGQARPTQPQLEQARRNLAFAMLGSFFALLVGAGAAIAGSQWLPEDRRAPVA
jgi:hypothetical protein